MEENKKSGLKLNGAPWYIALGCILIILASAYLGVLGTDMASVLALCVAIAVIFNEIGERLPIWNSYIGGGLLMVFFGTAVLVQFNLIPEKYVEGINTFISGDTGFLTFFIIFLIAGSILSLERDILLKSFAGYIPAILGGLVCAMLFGVVTGFVFGIRPSDILIKYVLPIMGGGNGAGAVPLSQIYEEVTGDPAANYYAFAIIILTIANIICILAGALLNKLGTVKTEWTGDKRNLLRNNAGLAREDKKVQTGVKDMAGAMMVALTCYAVGRLFSKVILPTIFGASIHQFAYMIIFVVILAATGIIPANICAGAKRLQSFMTGACSIIIMVCMGCDFDLMELVSACTPANVIIALMVVVGAILGSAVVGYLVGFYPIDSAVTAGLCMANRGGNGDIAVLGAADRMELIAYAQLSSRLGGGIVLIVASFMFSFML